MTYPRDEVVGAPDARDLVLVEELGDGPLGAGVDLHEEDVADVGEKQQQRLPPQDHLRRFKGNKLITTSVIRVRIQKKISMSRG